MTIRYKGTAGADAITPLLKLGAIPEGTRLIGSGSRYSAGLGCEGTVEITYEEERVRLTFRDADGTVSSDVTMAAWGDEGSHAYWYTVRTICAELVMDGGVAPDLAEAAQRARNLLEKVSLYDSDEAAVAPGGRAEAAIDYIRLKSGVTGRWLVALSEPFELLVEHPARGWLEVLMWLEDLPPGVCELGECAVVTLEAAPVPQWWLRPVMCSFENDLSDVTLETARLRLLDLGFEASEVSRLEKIAGYVADRYSFWADGNSDGDGQAEEPEDPSLFGWG